MDVFTYVLQNRLLNLARSWVMETGRDLQEVSVTGKAAGCIVLSIISTIEQQLILPKITCCVVFKLKIAVELVIPCRSCIVRKQLDGR